MITILYCDDYNIILWRADDFPQCLDYKCYPWSTELPTTCTNRTNRTPSYTSKGPSLITLFTAPHSPKARTSSSAGENHARIFDRPYSTLTVRSSWTMNLPVPVKMLFSSSLYLALPVWITVRVSVVYTIGTKL